MSKHDDAPMTPKRLFVIVIELVLVFMLALVLVGVIQQFLICPIRVSGNSMYDTICESDDKVYVLRVGNSYKKGDVIVFYKPNEGENDESENPSSKEITFSEFLSRLPIIGSRIHASDGEDSGSGYKAIIKRIVACPGDTVEFRDGYLFVKDKESGTERQNGTYRFPHVGVGDSYSHVLEDGEYFVMGDNRENSTDSEDYGPIQESMIYGKAVLLVHGDKDNPAGTYRTNF